MKRIYSSHWSDYELIDAGNDKKLERWGNIITIRPDRNAYEQAKQFSLATEINALAITKLDGTAKGGVVIGISDQFKIPVKYIGVGEGMEDLQVFNKYEFVDSLFKE